MTHTSTEQPEALLIAKWLRESPSEAVSWADMAAMHIERLHARVQELEAKVETGKRLLREEMERANRYAEASQARVPLKDGRLVGVIESFPGFISGDVDEFIAHIEAVHGITQEKQG